MTKGRDEHDPEGLPDAGLDSLFGEQQFQDYEDGVLGNPFVAPPAEQGSAAGAPPQQPVAPQVSGAAAAAASYPQPPAAAPQSRREAREAAAREEALRGGLPGASDAPHATEAPAGATYGLPGAGAASGATGPDPRAFAGQHPAAAPTDEQPADTAGAVPDAGEPQPAEWQSLHEQPEWEPATAAPAPRSGDGERKKFSPYLFWFGLTGMQKALVVTAGVLLLVIILVGLYAFGAGLAGSQTQKPPAQEPGGEPAPVSGPLAPGDHAWNTLQGGECISPFDTVWAESFTVVDCGVEHPAQLVSRGLIGDEVIEYQDAAGWQALLPNYCNPSLLDLGVAGQYTDLQFEFSYPGGATEWGNGDRDFFCFVTRSSGESLTGSLVPSE
ncbi:hypothetical protein FB562_2281 [Homoserinimonas aerilata]|uniref:Uncharacterized protein n=1 Tax=Homoserinimonas aerilata TaxID=1162970 RepID=A0A542YF87_9MICO|nr:hypothetical protein [Homoserinimonas aerilata]TQL46756.1 hypothetical protein FB562_2281 [Homoserinimonas aerilata]